MQLVIYIVALWSKKKRKRSTVLTIRFFLLLFGVCFAANGCDVTAIKVISSLSFIEQFQSQNAYFFSTLEVKSQMPAKNVQTNASIPIEIGTDMENERKIEMKNQTILNANCYAQMISD